MMRRRIKRSSLFTLIAVVALLSLGIGYAAWTDQALITGTVSTGTLDMAWSTKAAESSTNDASCTANVVDGALVIGVNNAYPGFSCVAEGLIVNKGTVPGKVTNVTVTNTGAGAGVKVKSCEGLEGQEISNSGAVCQTIVSFDSDENYTQGQNYTFSVSIDFETVGPSPLSPIG